MPPQDKVSIVDQKSFPKNDFLRFKQQTQYLFENNMISYNEMKIYTLIFDRSIVFAKDLVKVFRRCENHYIADSKYIKMFDNIYFKIQYELEKDNLSSGDIYQPIFKFFTSLTDSFKAVSVIHQDHELTSSMSETVNIHQKPYLKETINSTRTFIKEIEYYLKERKTIRVFDESYYDTKDNYMTYNQQRLVETLYLEHAKIIREMLSLENCDTSLQSELKGIDEGIRNLSRIINSRHCWASNYSNDFEIKIDETNNINGFPKLCYDLSEDYTPTIKQNNIVCKDLVNSFFHEIDNRLNCDFQGVDTNTLNTMETSEIFKNPSPDESGIIANNSSSISTSLYPQNILFLGYIMLFIKSIFKF